MAIEQQYQAEMLTILQTMMTNIENFDKNIDENKGNNHEDCIN